MLLHFIRIVATLPPQYPEAKQQQPRAGAFSPVPAPSKKSGSGRLRLHNTGRCPGLVPVCSVPSMKRSYWVYCKYKKQTKSNNWNGEELKDK